MKFIRNGNPGRDILQESMQQRGGESEEIVENIKKVEQIWDIVTTTFTTTFPCPRRDPG